MARLEWQADYACGVDYLDQEHRRLLDLVNEICEQSAHAADNETVGRGLGELHARVAEHFALEERLMQERDHIHYAAHKAQHEKLLDQIRTLMDAYEDGRCDSCATTLDQCLSGWLRKHLRRPPGLGNAAAG